MSRTRPTRGRTWTQMRQVRSLTPTLVPLSDVPSTGPDRVEPSRPSGHGSWTVRGRECERPFRMRRKILGFRRKGELKVWMHINISFKLAQQKLRECELSSFTINHSHPGPGPTDGSDGRFPTHPERPVAVQVGPFCATPTLSSRDSSRRRGVPETPRARVRCLGHGKSRSNPGRRVTLRAPRTSNLGRGVHIGYRPSPTRVSPPSSSDRDGDYGFRRRTSVLGKSPSSALPAQESPGCVSGRSPVVCLDPTYRDDRRQPVSSRSVIIPSLRRPHRGKCYPHRSVVVWGCGFNDSRRPLPRTSQTRVSRPSVPGSPKVLWHTPVPHPSDDGLDLTSRDYPSPFTLRRRNRGLVSVWMSVGIVLGPSPCSPATVRGAYCAWDCVCHARAPSRTTG